MELECISFNILCPNLGNSNGTQFQDWNICQMTLYAKCYSSEAG